MEKELAQILKVLAVETRLKIISQLREHPLCVNALADRLGVSQSAVSQHLRLLKSAGLVTDERMGYHVHYSLNREVLEAHAEKIGAFFS